MVSFDQFLSTTFWNNTGQQYLIALAVFIGLFIILKLFDRYLVNLFMRAAKKTKTNWDDMVVDFISAIHWQFYAFISFYIGTLLLELPEIVETALRFLMIIFVFFYAAQGLSRIVNSFTEKQIEKRKRSENSSNTSMIRTFGTMFKIAIYAIAVLMILSNFGVEITPLIASLGIGGIAIAIALQAVLSDLFAAFAIFFDKPFKEGDFVVVGNDMGTIKHIGIKTTRIQALGGQELVVSNTEMTNTRVNNYKRMKERRIVTSLGVEYSTPANKLKKINDIIKTAVESTKQARFDRSHFKTFADFSLNFEFVYYVEVPDYAKFMDIQQEINFKIHQAFEKEKIVFAFPTQTIHVDSFKKK